MEKRKRLSDVVRKQPNKPYKTTPRVEQKQERPDREIPKKFSNYLDKKQPPEPEAVSHIELYKMGYFNAYKECLPMVDAVRDILELVKNHAHKDKVGCLFCQITDTCEEHLKHLK